MTEAIRANRLRIHREPEEDDRSRFGRAFPRVERLCRSFRAATGWPLRLMSAEHLAGDADPLWTAPVDPGQGKALGYLTIGQLRDGSSHCGSDAPARPCVPAEQATELAGSLAELLQELIRTRTALASREAELSVGVPIAHPADTPLQLAMRMEMVLRGGAEGIGCHAAGLYLLDAATTELKLRSHWGLAPDRLADAARPLQGAVGDLEALTGHAVVLENRTLLDYWNVPEPCEAAICVPVSTATALLGTLWLYSEDPRPFSDRETNLAEIVAGRLAVELERETLLSEAVASLDERYQLDTAQALLQMQLPTAGPESNVWEISGWAATDMASGSPFYDWFPATNGQLGVAIGETAAVGLVGMLAAQSVRTSLRAHAAHETDPAQLLSRTNADLWRGAAGDQFAATLCATFDLDDSQTVRLAAAGSIGAWLLNESGPKSVIKPQIPLGVEPVGAYRTTTLRLGPSECLVVASEAVCQRFAAGGDPEDDLEAALRTIGDADRETAHRLQRAVVERLDSAPRANAPSAGALLVIRRKDVADSDWP